MAAGKKLAASSNAKTPAKPVAKKPPASKKKPKASEPSGWIVREVAFATFRKAEDIKARRLTESLELLEKGIDRWNQWRGDHPAFIPYLPNVNLSWRSKHKGDLEGFNLSNAILSDSDFEGISFAGADLTGADMRRANLIDCGLGEIDLTGANLTGADLTEAHLGFGTLDNASLSNAILNDAELWEASLQGASLAGASLEGVEASGVHAMNADFSFARMLDSDFSSADFSGANLTYATLVGSNLSKAILTGCNVYGVSVWDVDLTDAEQSRLTIARDGESSVLVDDIEVAQFVHLLLDHRKLRKTIDAVAERGVLILGRFSNGGLELLEALAARLRELKYLPILFDFDRPASRNYTETIMTLAGLSRFVVADLSGPSVPQELHATVPNFKIPFVPILQTGSRPYAMLTDILEYPWVVQPIVRFQDKEDLQALTRTQIVVPAEKKHKARQQLLQQLFR